VYHPPREDGGSGYARATMHELRVPGAEVSASLHGQGSTVVVLGHGPGGDRHAL